MVKRVEDDTDIYFFFMICIKTSNKKVKRIVVLAKKFIIASVWRQSELVENDLVQKEGDGNVMIRVIFFIASLRQYKVETEQDMRQAYNVLPIQSTWWRWNFDDIADKRENEPDALLMCFA